MNKFQKKLNGLTKYNLEYFKEDSFRIGYKCVRKNIKKEILKQFTIKQIISMPIEEIWNADW